MGPVSVAVPCMAYAHAPSNTLHLHWLPSEKGLPAWLQEMAKHMLAHIAKDGSEALPPIAVSTFSKSGKVYGSGDRAWETTWRVCVHDA